MESKDSLLINEIAFRVGDENFKKFPKHHYERVLGRVKRIISRKYKLNKREYVFNSAIEEGEIPIEIPSFISPVSLTVNNQEYELRSKIDYDLEDRQYYLYRDYNKLRFSYHPRTKEDKLVLTYLADIDINEDYIPEIEPVIPDQYNEELITHSVVEVCKIALSKSTGEEANKYATLFKLYQSNIKEFDQNLVKKEGWAVIKPKWVV